MGGAGGGYFHGYGMGVGGEKKKMCVGWNERETIMFRLALGCYDV